MINSSDCPGTRPNGFSGRNTPYRYIEKYMTLRRAGFSITLKSLQYNTEVNPSS